MWSPVGPCQLLRSRGRDATRASPTMARGRKTRDFAQRNRAISLTLQPRIRRDLGVPVGEFVLWYVPVMQRISPIEGDVEAAPPPAPTTAAREPKRRVGDARCSRLTAPIDVHENSIASADGRGGNEIPLLRVPCRSRGRQVVPAIKGDAYPMLISDATHHLRSA